MAAVLDYGRVRIHAAAPGGSSGPTGSLASSTSPSGSANGSALKFTAHMTSSRAKTSEPGGESRHANPPLGRSSIARR